MIYISIGIALLAIGSIWMAERQAKIELDKAYWQGFKAGTETILDRKYQRLDELQKKKD